MTINFFCIFLQFCLIWPSSSVELNEFYPFGKNADDAALHPNDDEYSGEISIPMFPFFDKSFSSLFVNTNGVISFNVTVAQYTPQRFPLGDGRVLVAPFWADVDTRRGGNVWYRACVNEDVLTKASRDVRNAFPKFRHFSATWVFVTTWEKVPFYGSSDKSNARNTFQSVLITNGRYSFVRFNYHEITWTTGTASQGNANGLGGVEAECGFKAGDGNYSYSITGSRNIRVLDLPFMSNVNEPGVWMFRIDEATIEEADCNTKSSMWFWVIMVISMLVGIISLIYIYRERSNRHTSHT